MPDQLRHILIPSRATTGFEAGDVGWVVVDALDRYLCAAEDGVQGRYEAGADYAADVAGFGGAAGEDGGEVFAGVGGEVVAGGAGEVDIGAVGGEAGRRDAGEAAGGCSVSFRGMCGWKKTMCLTLYSVSRSSSSLLHSSRSWR